MGTRAELLQRAETCRRLAGAFTHPDPAVEALLALALEAEAEAATPSGHSASTPLSTAPWDSQRYHLRRRAG
jgi:hypothetical protein